MPCRERSGWARRSSCSCQGGGTHDKWTGHTAVTRRIIDWFLFKRRRVQVAKVIVATVLSAGVVGVFLASSGILDADGTPIEPRDSAEIVLEAEVKNFEIASPHGPIDPKKREWEINVVGNAILMPFHRWIVRFRVTRVVHGTFDSGEVRMLIHSPSQDGLSGPGRKFVLCLRRRSKPPTVVDPGGQSPGTPYFVLAKTLYEMVADSRSTYPG